MLQELELKNIVKEKYSQIAVESCGDGCCCGSGPTLDYSIMSESYDQKDGYVKDADLGLGCGIPTDFANIQSGNTVLDLGSGAGNDVFVARQIVGESGKVYGLDMTQEMLNLANKNLAYLKYQNIEFVLGEIDNMPFQNDLVDVIISNCVLNLVPNKQKAFSEMYRVIKPGGHFCISDIVLEGEIPTNIQKAAEMYSGCVSGAMLKDDYLNVISDAGFEDVKILKSKPIIIPDDVLKNYINENDFKKYFGDKTPIYSVTVYGVKS